MAAKQELSRSKFIERALALYMELTERGYIDPKTGLLESGINRVLRISKARNQAPESSVQTEKD